MALLVLVLAAAVAQASPSAIYNACANGTSLSGFSKSDLQAALRGVPADLDEYYACSAQINAALVDKATRNIPGGGSVKGAKERLKLADVNDLTTPAQRKRLQAQVERETRINPSKPLGGPGSGVHTEDGRTLASSTAPGTPVLLIIGLIGLLVLIGADLAGRLANLRREDASPPEQSRRGDD